MNTDTAHNQQQQRYPQTQSTIQTQGIPTGVAARNHHQHQVGGAGAQLGANTTSGSTGSVAAAQLADIKREKDLIRNEMERVVDRMQQIEQEIDNGGGREGEDDPESTARKEELYRLRAQLGELRNRMKVVMAATTSAAKAPATSASRSGSSATVVARNAAPTTSLSNQAQQPQHYPTTGTTAPSGLNATATVEYSTVGREALQTPSIGKYYTPVREASNLLLENGQPSSSAVLPPYHQLTSLRQRHEEEKMVLRQEYERLLGAMEQRHSEEARSCQSTCAEEEAHRREYEESRLRMERAQERLQQLGQNRQQYLSQQQGPVSVSALPEQFRSGSSSAPQQGGDGRSGYCYPYPGGGAPPLPGPSKPYSDHRY